MTIETASTIAALATPRGTGGVAIIRISGPQSWSIAQALSDTKLPWTPGKVSYGWIIDPRDQQPLDEVLILPFQGPHSFTGEDCVEIHCHGGLYLSKALLNLCLEQGAQAAVAGEFTRRAFLNGRIDLTQAESILDLIHAQGSALVKLSAHNLHQKSVSHLLQRYLLEIGSVQADLTASIDFPDEVDEPERTPLGQQLLEFAQQLKTQIDINQRHQVLRDGLEIAILGLPNAGKSSLFNALLASDRSIVTDIAGTTRDIIREPLSIQGIPVTLVDTAGLRETADQVESLGVERSWSAMETAEAIIYVYDGTVGLSQYDLDLLAKIPQKIGLLVQNKCDASEALTPPTSLPKSWPLVSTSAKHGDGLQAILDWLSDISEQLTPDEDMAFLLSQRQIQALLQVHQDLQEAGETLLSDSLPLDLATVPLTHALLELQGLLGQDTTEMVLDTVFARFCVGK